MRFLTSIGCSSTSKPATVALPSEGGRKHVRIRMVVVFPAPLGPRKPTICPFCTSNEIWSTATVRAYLFVRPLTVIIDGLGETAKTGRKRLRRGSLRSGCSIHMIKTSYLQSQFGGWLQFISPRRRI